MLFFNVSGEKHRHVFSYCSTPTQPCLLVPCPRNCFEFSPFVAGYNASPVGPSEGPSFPKIHRGSKSYAINTYKSPTKQTALSLFRMNTYGKRGGGCGYC